MFFLAKQKLLNVSRLQAELEPETIESIHEWYANPYSTTFKGKFVILYVHAPTKLTILVKGKSLLQSTDIFMERLELFLIRKGIDLEKRNKIIPSGKPIMLKTASKSVLGHMNEYKRNLEYWFYEYQRYEDIDLNRLEDLLSEMAINIDKKGYDKPMDLFRKLVC